MRSLRCLAKLGIGVFLKKRKTDPLLERCLESVTTIASSVYSRSLIILWMEAIS